MFKIASRMEEMLKTDNLTNPQAVCRVLEQEFRSIVANYLTLSKDFVVRFKQERGKNIFFVEFEAEKIKPFGYLPSENGL